MSEQTLGEKRVKVDFNVTESSVVDGIKSRSAKLINLVEELRTPKEGVASSEKHRLISLAQTAYEEAAMWAVKANFTE